VERHGQAASSGSKTKAPGSAGGYLLSKLRTQTTYSNNLKLLHSTCCLSLCARGACMKSLVVKRSVVIAGRKTSVSLEETFWKSLREIGICRNMGLSAMVAAIDSERQYGNLSSSIRLFVLNFYRNQLDSGSGASRQYLPLDDKCSPEIIRPHDDS